MGAVERALVAFIVIVTLLVGVLLVLGAATVVAT